MTKHTGGIVQTSDLRRNYIVGLVPSSSLPPKGSVDLESSIRSAKDRTVIEIISRDIDRRIEEAGSIGRKLCAEAKARIQGRR